MRQPLLIPLLFSSLSVVSNCFQARPWGAIFLQRPSTSSTAVALGLRDMLRFRRNKKEPDDENKTNRDSSGIFGRVTKKSRPSSTSSGSTDEQEDLVVSKTINDERDDVKTVIRMGEDPITQKFDASSVSESETVQERINRVKSGRMTEEEKRAYLQAALSTGSTPETRRPLRMSTRTEEEVKAQSSTASPFPIDSIYRDLASGAAKKTSASAKTSNADLRREKSRLDSEDQKRKYLDSITDPNRFKFQKTSASPPPRRPEQDTRSLPPSMKPPPIMVSVDSSQPVVSSSTSSGLPRDLGQRLEAAAIAEEERKKRMEQERIEREQQLELVRIEREQRLEELAQQRRAEQVRREAEMEELRRKQQEEIERKKEVERLKEQARLKEIVEKQENFWAKKLAAEKAAKEAEAATTFGDADEASTAGATKDETPKKPPVDESDLLEETMADREELRIENQMIIDRAVGLDVPSKPPRGSFLKEDQLKKKKQEEDEYLRRLKAFNSPLPSPPPRKAGHGVAGRPPTVFQPQVSVSAPGATRVPAPTPASGPVIGSDDSAPSEEDPVALPAPKKESSTPQWKNIFGGYSGKKEATVKPAASTPAVASKTSGPIRMSLPLEDQEEEGVDFRSDATMSIKDALKRTSGGADDSVSQVERSKQWGVDISKFL